ncbi:MAG: prohibitin family protein [Cyclobacteriaceae bacterium]|nr:prohibitin family protein [Cyclobacteriaceae bacterium]
MDNRKFLPFIIAGVIALIIVLYLSSEIFITIKAGERGVLYKRFQGGTDFEVSYTPGFHMKAPWNDIFVYNVRENIINEKMDVLDKSGLSITVDVSVRFFPIYNRIAYLHEYFGEGYVDLLVKPEVRSTVRRVMGRFTAEEIYSTKRAEVEDAIIQETEAILKNQSNNIQMQALLIRSINLPEQIKNAIESKLQQEQESLAYQFKLTKETAEAERKRIEAEGTSRYNEIINASLSNQILKQRGIEATLELAKSPNAKVIVIGSGEDGLPLILGNN